MHFQKVREDPFDVVQCVRAVRMTGELNALPRGQVFINALLGFFQLFPECIQFGVCIKIVCAAEIFPFLQFFFQFSDGFFKIEDHICHNSYTPWRTSVYLQLICVFEFSGIMVFKIFQSLSLKPQDFQKVCFWGLNTNFGLSFGTLERVKTPMSLFVW